MLLDSIVNIMEPDQTAPEGRWFDPDPNCLSRLLWQATSVRNFRTFNITNSNIAGQ